MKKLLRAYFLHKARQNWNCHHKWKEVENNRQEITRIGTDSIIGIKFFVRLSCSKCGDQKINQWETRV